MLLSLVLVTGTISPGDKIQQPVTGGTAFGYAMSYDEDIILKYYQDRFGLGCVWRIQC